MKWTSTRLVNVFALLLAPVAALAGPVNVNTASAKTISEELTGVGLSKAQAIVDYRQQHGPFESVEELADVKGIGQRTLELNQENILLKTPESPSR